VDGSYTTQLGPDSTPSKNSPTTISVHKGYKIFLNVCWDGNVPPPPERTEDQIRKAMMGADFDQGLYFVPVVVSDGRRVSDKAGKPSIVFDCVFNGKLRSRANKDIEFKTFLTEIALEQVEDKSGLTLSREIATPNISSKGPLDERTVSIPVSFNDGPGPSNSKQLIQEITPPSSSPSSSAMNAKGFSQPEWTAEVEKDGITLTVEVPGLNKNSIALDTTLDVEPHRIIFKSGDKYALDLRLSPQGKLSAAKGELDRDSSPAKGRGLQPDGARAECRIYSSSLVVFVPWQ